MGGPTEYFLKINCNEKMLIVWTPPFLYLYIKIPSARSVKHQKQVPILNFAVEIKMSFFGHHHHHHHNQDAPAAPPQNHPVRIYSKAAENYSLTIRNGEVVLAPANPRDEYQVFLFF